MGKHINNFIDQKHIYLFALLGLIFFTCTAPIAHALVITQGCNIQPAGSGVIRFSHTVAGTRGRLNGAYLELYGCSQNGELFGLFAASVSTNANLTIVDIRPWLITLQVNAASGLTSTTLIRFLDKAQPTDVTGAAWSYKESTQTLTLNVYHHSPETITIRWMRDAANLQTRYLYNLEFMSLTITIIAAGSAISILAGNASPKDVLLMIFLIILASVMTLLVSGIIGRFLAF